MDTEETYPAQAEETIDSRIEQGAEFFADILADFASSSFGVSCSERTKENWKQALSVIVRVDSVFDDEDAAPKEEMLKALQSVLDIISMRGHLI